jgi:hypothetical protein
MQAIILTAGTEANSNSPRNSSSFCSSLPDHELSASFLLNSGFEGYLHGECHETGHVAGDYPLCAGIFGASRRPKRLFRGRAVERQAGVGRRDRQRPEGRLRLEPRDGLDKPSGEALSNWYTTEPKTNYSNDLYNAAGTGLLQAQMQALVDAATSPCSRVFLVPRRERHRQQHGGYATMDAYTNRFQACSPS